MKELDVFELESIDRMFDEEAERLGLSREEYEFNSRFDAEYEKNLFAIEELEDL